MIPDADISPSVCGLVAEAAGKRAERQVALRRLLLNCAADKQVGERRQHTLG